MVFNYFFPVALSSFLTLFFSVVLYVGKLPRRKMWRLWLIVGFIACVAICLGFAYIEDIIYGDRDSSITFFNVFSQQILILITNFILIVCVSETKFDGLLLCFILSVATSRAVSDIYGILSLIGAFRFNWVNFENVAFFNFDVVNLLNWIIFYIIHFIFTGGIYLIFKNISTGNRIENMYLFGMSFCMLFICLAVDSIISVYLSDGGVVAVTLRLVLVFCSFFVLILIREVQRGSLARSELETAEKIIAQQARQYEQSSKNIELINIKCHDLRKQIRRMGNLNADADEIAEMVRIYDSSVKTGNDTLDVILTGYGLRFDAEKIEFCCMLNGRKFEKFSVSDLHALFGNLLDNALEYLSSLKEDDKKFVKMNTKERGDYFILTVENYFEGDIFFDKDGNPITSKSDKENHGFGIRSIKYITKKYGGFNDIEVFDRSFTVRCCFPND